MICWLLLTHCRQLLLVCRTSGGGGSSGCEITLLLLLQTNCLVIWSAGATYARRLLAQALGPLALVLACGRGRASGQLELVQLLAVPLAARARRRGSVGARGLLLLARLCKQIHHHRPPVDAGLRARLSLLLLLLLAGQLQRRRALALLVGHGQIARAEVHHLVGVARVAWPQVVGGRGLVALFGIKHLPYERVNALGLGGGASCLVWRN